MDRFTRFRTLLLREWMQHRTGWLVLMALPSLVMLGLGLLDREAVQIGSVDAGELQTLPLVLQALVWTVATLALAGLLVALTLLAQLPGLARRDQQDRSIEFWRSLPVSHVQGVGATVLMHLLLLPAAALLAGLVGAQLVVLVTVVLHHGPLAWLQLPWGLLLPSYGLGALRLVLGLLLGVLWLSPLLLLTMAASAWLKRWAVPVVSAASLLGVYWLDARLPVPLVGPAFRRIGTEALYALVAPDLFDGPNRLAQSGLADAVAGLPMALLQDTGRVLAGAATPAFGLALAGGVLGFALLVLRRQRAV
ncbi:hypothetical protein [Pseudaquabacterium pictum]|uniref:Uncharacterized protein n=1 Tax=Pseudaquabacterium pictum TaxID=2315236 RepID=A0A480AKL1_9BURK|nr:hypothetical protein [Rubrivivax pictus]GCL61260.1 hypothetical protein AQPW35_03410 [Rubrivivax pictus]